MTLCGRASRKTREPETPMIGRAGFPACRFAGLSRPASLPRQLGAPPSRPHSSDPPTPHTRLPPPPRAPPANWTPRTRALIRPIPQHPTTDTHLPSTSIQRHPTPNVGRHVKVFPSVYRRLTFVKAPLGNDFQWQLSLPKLRLLSRARLPGNLPRQKLLPLLPRQRRRGRNKTRAGAGRGRLR